MTEQHRLGLLGVDIGGLDPVARERIEVIGFDAWLDEVAGTGTAMLPMGNKSRTKRECKVRCTCVIDGKEFFAQRSDAVYCSARCRDKGRRRGLQHRGTPSDKERARAAVQDAIKDARLVRPEACSRCHKPDAKQGIEAHHPDYSRPLDVVWLCGQCHRAEHPRGQN